METRCRASLRGGGSRMGLVKTIREDERCFALFSYYATVLLLQLLPVHRSVSSLSYTTPETARE